MKKMYAAVVKGILLGSLGFILCAATPSYANAANPLKIGIVNFKECVEKSKIGKHEQTVFESLKKQMESSLIEKEKSLNEVANKLNDPDYLDTLSQAAEAELKHKFRILNQEISQFQNQYYQALNQTNVKVVQQLHDLIAKTVQTLAKENGYDLVLNEESSFFYKPELDLTEKVVNLLDKMDKLPEGNN